MTTEHASGWNFTSWTTAAASVVIEVECKPFRIQLCAALGALLLTGCSDSRGTPGSAELLQAVPCEDVSGGPRPASAEWIVERSDEKMDTLPGLFPADVAVKSDATLLVADKADSRIVHLGHSGQIISQFGRPGEGPGEFVTPSSVDVDVAGRIYAADRQGRISVFLPGGVLHRSFRLSNVSRVSDIVILPNGNIAIARDTGPEENGSPYVVIVDSLGKTVREVLRTSRAARSARPLLGYQINLVRLSNGPEGQFAVWYPAENYVQMFDSAGDSISTYVGCLPPSLLRNYAEQALRNTGSQGYVILTLGVGMRSENELVVASRHRTADEDIVRLRRIRVREDSTEAVDFDVTQLAFASYRFEVLSDTLAVGFNTSVPEMGLRIFHFARK